MAKEKQILNSDFKVGVLGGGQLGKMLALAAGNWHLPLYILDEKADFPAGPFTFFTEGNFKDYDDVYRFGRDKDVLTIEIEHVNTDALRDLEKKGVIVHPGPDKLDIIKDKGRQKEFYLHHKLPTANFKLYSSGEEVRQLVQAGKLALPFVQKSRTAGYDGRGVAVIRTLEDLEEKLLPGACVIEDLVPIQKELAVIVARNARGEVKAFPTVEMTFNPEANLVEFLLCPAQISPAIARAAEDLAMRVIKAYDLCGLLAVELFLTEDGDLLINEVAPRPHNSGHHTIDSCYTSQYEQHLRAILNLPLGSTRLKSPSVMVNILGAEGYTGTARYEGLEECLAIEGVKIHLYGKSKTKPFRKMGHATVLDPNIEYAKEKAEKVQKLLRVIG